MATYRIIKSETSQQGIMPFASDGRKVYVISDLHLAAGLNTNGNYDGTENFYADDSLVRFLDHLQEKSTSSGAMLIINGDFIDFLRITNVPSFEEELLCWQATLENAGIKKTTSELRASVTKKEVRYGLKTNDYKTIWKLNLCMDGHKPLFQRLAQWVADGNELIIVKGNHDLEWLWPAVQQYFRKGLQQLAGTREEMEHMVTTEERAAVSGAESSRVVPFRLPGGIDLKYPESHGGIHFVDHALTIDNKIHIEHGHLYERTTAVDGAPTVNNGEELNLPFGSFFNRYLINRLELSYPFLDNVRPSQNILPVLIRERFPLAIKVLLHYIPFMLLIIPKRLYWYTLKYFLNILFIIVLPVLITVYALYQSIRGSGASIDTTGVPKFLLNLIQNFGFLFLSYIFGRILAMAGLKSPPTLSVHAKKIMDDNPSLEAVVFGHTHDPEQKLVAKNKWYFNTGTWIPVFETSSANVRMDKTFTFIAIDCNQQLACRERLQRWNDDACREDSMILNDKI